MPTSLIILAVLAVLLVIVLIKTAVVVPNQQAFVVERLGKFRTVLYAGFHLLIPFLDLVAYRRSLKEQVLDVPKQTCITRDNVSVDIDGVLYLQVVNPEKSAYGISDFLTGSVQLAQTALRSAIGKLELDRTFEERHTINQEVIAALDAATTPWGIKVLRYEIRDIAPPASVMQAMEKQMRAEREKRAVIAQSEGEMQSQINRAEGAKAAAIAESEGRMQALMNQARGEASLIETVARATSEGIRLVAGQMQAPGGVQAANLRVAESWIQQFGAVAKESTTLIIPQDLADLSGIVAGLTRVIRQAPAESAADPSAPSGEPSAAQAASASPARSAGRNAASTSVGGFTFPSD
ncbi:MAG: paraslipin [Desulfovibrionaceae bacterium]|nr:paraslipin [Desulfovibrionaceae bacterium]